MELPRPERRCTDDDQLCCCPSPHRRARRQWAPGLSDRLIHRTRPPRCSRPLDGTRVSNNERRARALDLPKGTVMFSNSPELQMMLARDRQEELRRIAGRNRLRHETKQHRRRGP